MSKNAYIFPKYEKKNLNPYTIVYRHVFFFKSNLTKRFPIGMTNSVPSSESSDPDTCGPISISTSDYSKVPIKIGFGQIPTAISTPLPQKAFGRKTYVNSIAPKLVNA